MRKWGRGKRRGLERRAGGEVVDYLLEHDDPADEGSPERGAPGGGEAEEVGHLGGRDGGPRKPQFNRFFTIYKKKFCQKEKMLPTNVFLDI